MCIAIDTCTSYEARRDEFCQEMNNVGGITHLKCGIISIFKVCFDLMNQIFNRFDHSFLVVTIRVLIAYDFVSFFGSPHLQVLENSHPYTMM